MSAKIIPFDEHKKKRSRSSLRKNGREASVSSIFAGKAAKLPELLTADIHADIAEQLATIISESGHDIHTKQGVRKQPARAAYEDISEAQIGFYLVGEDGKEKSRPFLVLSATHTKDANKPLKTFVYYTVHMNFNGNHRRSACLAKGYDFEKDISPNLKLALSEALRTELRIEAQKPYQSWAPK